MDNASKALIIAGAILIAVMLVSLGVMLYNTAAGVAETTVGSVEALGVAGFNAQFEQYFGNGKSKEQALGLYQKVMINNKNNDITVYINFLVRDSNPGVEGKYEGITNLQKQIDYIEKEKNVRYIISVDSETNGGKDAYYNDGTIQTILVEQVAR